MRFNPNATTLPEAATYLAERAVQLLKHGAVLQSLECLGEEAVLARWTLPTANMAELGSYTVESLEGTFASVYLLEQYRGQGKYVKLVREVGLPIVTHWECHLSHFLHGKCIPYVSFDEVDEYHQIQKHYGDLKAEGSQTWRMHHIDEGLAVLRTMPGTWDRGDAIRAFCIAPLIQTDRDLKANWETIFSMAPAVALAMEYRAVANAALVHHTVPFASAIKLSTLVEVNHMLLADKVQSRKDFERLHMEGHANAVMARYFRLWFERLSIFEATYQDLVAALDQPGRVLESFKATL